MDIIEKKINLIAQNRIEFNEGVTLILNNSDFDFKKTFNTLIFFIFNSIPEKATYSTPSYQEAISSIPLRQTFTPIVLLTKFPTKIAFQKLRELPENEYEKIIISLLWIFKITDTERRETECKNGCGHDWHENI